MDLRHKRVALLGFGVEGLGTYRYLRAAYPHRKIAVFDEAEPGRFRLPDGASPDLLDEDALDLRLGPVRLQELFDNDVIVKAPGIPDSHPVVRAAIDAGKPVTSHLQLFFELAGPGQAIGVTGTKGKSTTATLLHAMLREAGFDALLGGNVGAPPLEFAATPAANKIFVIEMSSYQLASLSVSPHWAVLLDVTPEHLTYHGGFEPYAAAKEHITKFQTAGDHLIYCRDYPLPSQIAARSQAAKFELSRRDPLRDGCWTSSDAIVLSRNGADSEVCRFSDIQLKGAFNRINVMAAASAAALAGADLPSIRRAIGAFRGLPHRIEFVGRRRGIDFYDDSISTVPEATLAALEALGENVHTLLLGGHDRNLDFTDFARKLESSSPQVLILFPATGDRILAAIERNWRTGRPLPRAHRVNDMASAVRIAFEATPAGKICLLSPASPSFGLFRDYRDRGEQFQKFANEGGG